MDYLKFLIPIIIFCVSLYFTIRHFKIVRSLNYIERVNSPSLVGIRKDLETWLNSHDSDQQKLDALADDKELLAKFNIIYNVMTELGIAYKYRIVHRKLIREIFFPLVPNYWKKLHFVIYDRRLRGAKVGEHFEYLAKQIAINSLTSKDK